MRILVLGSDARSVLAVVRSLGRAGHEIYLAGVPDRSVALASRYVRKVLHMAAYGDGGEAWRLAFQDLLATHAIDLVIPCSDPTIIPLQALCRQMETTAMLYVLPDEVYRIANDKIEMYRIAQGLGIPVPRGALVSDEAEMLRALDELPGPWVFKPPHSYSHDALDTRWSVGKAYTRDKAVSMGMRFLRRGVFQIQENFTGKGVGTEVLCDRGEILLAFQHLRIHEPLHGGGSSYRRGMPTHAGMLEAARRIVQRLAYTGVAMLEFKWDPDTDTWVFLEINARFWGSLPLALASGADFPRALVEFLVDGRRAFDYPIRHDIHSRNIELDLDWMLSNVRADKRNPYLSSLPWHVVMLESLNIARGRERWDTLTLDDPAPFLRMAALIGAQKTGALARRIRCSASALALTRTIRRRRLRALLAGAKRIGFVCHGNICRSPFAEIYARARMKGRDFFSAGLHAERDRGCPDQAIAAAGLQDVDLHPHRSRALTPAAVGEADILFVFDRENLRDMQARFPDARARTFLLTDAATEAETSIDDPNERGPEAFRVAYGKIRRCVDALARPGAYSGD